MLTTRQMQHVVEFLGTTLAGSAANGDFINTYEELAQNIVDVIAKYDSISGKATALNAIAYYAYDDENVRDGIAENWLDYCDEQNIEDFLNIENETDY